MGASKIGGPYKTSRFGARPRSEHVHGSRQHAGGWRMSACDIGHWPKTWGPRRFYRSLIKQQKDIKRQWLFYWLAWSMYCQIMTQKHACVWKKKMFICNFGLDTGWPVSICRTCCKMCSCPQFPWAKMPTVIVLYIYMCLHIYVYIYKYSFRGWSRLFPWILLRPCFQHSHFFTHTCPAQERHIRKLYRKQTCWLTKIGWHFKANCFVLETKSSST